MNKYTKEILKAVEAAGWTWRQGKHGFILYPADGSKPFMMHSVHHWDGPAVKKIKSALRKQGVDL